jgi:hypothetical protein
MVTSVASEKNDVNVPNKSVRVLGLVESEMAGGCSYGLDDKLWNVDN